jgi:hypothetical protein
VRTLRLLVAALAPIGFAVSYAASGQKWWQNDFGTRLVLIEAALIPMAGVLAVVFWFFHGLLNTPVMAWIEIGSPWWSAGMLIWQSRAFVRMAREDREARGDTRSSGRRSPAHGGKMGQNDQEASP